MNFAFLATLALLLCSTACAIAPVKLSGEQLRAAIAGVWFSEEPMMRHMEERMQYFPDGRFIGNDRISHSQQPALHSQDGHVRAA